MCRFYRAPAFGDSHFYSASPTECAQTAAAHPVDWIYESPNVFYVQLPDTATGVCPAGTMPVYRFFNRSRPTTATRSSARSATQMDQSILVDRGRLRPGSVLSDHVRGGGVERLEAVLDGYRRRRARSPPRPRRRSRSCRTSRRRGGRPCGSRRACASGSMPTCAVLLVGRRDLAARARLHEAQHDIADRERVDVVLVVRRRGPSTTTFGRKRFIGSAACPRAARRSFRSSSDACSMTSSG